MFVGSLVMYIKHYAIDNDVFTTVVVQCDMISSAICFKYARVNFSDKQNCTSPLDKTSRLAEITIPICNLQSCCNFTLVLHEIYTCFQPIRRAWFFMFIITLRTAHKGKPLVTSFSRLLLSVLLFPEELEPCFFKSSGWFIPFSSGKNSTCKASFSHLLRGTKS